MKLVARTNPGMDATQPGRIRWTGLRVAGCVAVAAALCAAVVPAIGAVAASRTVTYYACVARRTGALKVVSASARCAAGQHKISWNNIGPAGPRGPRGRPGPVTGYVDTVSNNVPLSKSGTTVATLQLPTGKFLLMATFYLVNLGTSSDAVKCSLVSGSGTIVDQAFGTLSALTGSSPDQTMALQGATTAGGKITVVCSSGGSADFADSVIMTATQVTSLVVSSG